MPLPLCCYVNINACFLAAVVRNRLPFDCAENHAPQSGVTSVFLRSLQLYRLPACHNTPDPSSGGLDQPLQRKCSPHTDRRVLKPPPWSSAQSPASLHLLIDCRLTPCAELCVYLANHRQAHSFEEAPRVGNPTEILRRRLRLFCHKLPVAVHDGNVGFRHVANTRPVTIKTANHRCDG